MTTLRAMSTVIRARSKEVVQTTVHVPKGLKGALKAIAAATKHPVNEVVRCCLIWSLNSLRTGKELPAEPSRAEAALAKKESLMLALHVPLMCEVEELMVASAYTGFTPLVVMLLCMAVKQHFLEEGGSPPEEVLAIKVCG